MDSSCQIFNLLLGSKRAATELRRYFAAFGDVAAAATATNMSTASRTNEGSSTCSSLQSSSTSSTLSLSTTTATLSSSSATEEATEGEGKPKQLESNGNNEEQPPRSPLRQLQRKITGMANGLSKLVEDKKKNSSSFAATSSHSGKENRLSGTYRATLVDTNEEEEEEDDGNDFTHERDAFLPSRDATASEEDTTEEPGVRWATIGCWKDQSTHPTFAEMQQTDNNITNECKKIDNAGSSHNGKCKRVILYGDNDDDEMSRERSEQPIVASAQVYNFVSELGEKRAKLKQVGLLSWSSSSETDESAKSFEQSGEAEIPTTNAQRLGDYMCSDNNTHKINDINNHDDDGEQEQEQKQVGEWRRMGENRARDQTSIDVRRIVRTFETCGGDGRLKGYGGGRTKKVADRSPPAALASHRTTAAGKPVTFVKPLRAGEPVRNSQRARDWLVAFGAKKPASVEELLIDHKFLERMFDAMEPLDRCAAAQVCRLWRDILYANSDYWKGLVNVIDCVALRREHLIDCIVSSLQSAKLKQQQQQQQANAINNKDSCNLSKVKPPQSHQEARITRSSSRPEQSSTVCDWNNHQQQQHHHHRELEGANSIISTFALGAKRSSDDSLFDIDRDEVWRIQEICNRFAHRSNADKNLKNQQQQQSVDTSTINYVSSESNNNNNESSTNCFDSKSSSIPSQISSTFSSGSVSSLFSPLSDQSSRIESIKEKIYMSLDHRGFDAMCLFGATDDDIQDLVSKIPDTTRERITVVKLNNCCISNKGLELFIGTFKQVEEMELSGCNDLNNSIEFNSMSRLNKLILTDCVNIADGFAHKLVQVIPQLRELTIQAYHLTDAFIEYVSLNADTSGLTRLELPNCKEITNQSLYSIAKHFPHLESLSISGSTKIDDQGIEILAEQSRRLRSLDLSWCSRITDVSLECIACDLSETLTDLILDRNVHITDIGLSYLATMNKLKLLHIRWCHRITDSGLESIISMKSLRFLSLAGIHQVTVRSLLCIVETDLLELELTNCSAVNSDLIDFITARMHNCNIIY